MPKGFDIEDIDQSDIESIFFIKPQAAISTYADEGKNGVYIIETKNGPIMYNVKEMNDLQEKGAKARKELKEKADKAKEKLKEKSDKAKNNLKERSGVTDNN